MMLKPRALHEGAMIAARRYMIFLARAGLPRVHAAGAFRFRRLFPILSFSIFYAFSNISGRMMLTRAAAASTISSATGHRR